MKKDDVVLYEDKSCVCVGRIGGMWNKESWYVIPLDPFRNVVKRKEKFLRPIGEIKKFLTNTK